MNMSIDTAGGLRQRGVALAQNAYETLGVTTSGVPTATNARFAAAIAAVSMALLAAADAVEGRK